MLKGSRDLADINGFLKRARKVLAIFINNTASTFLRNQFIYQYSQFAGVEPENSLVLLTISKPLAYALACTLNEYTVPGLRPL